MQRPPLPAVIRDITADRSAARTLLVAAAALAAAGLDPRVYSPGLASVQSAVRARSNVEDLLLLAAVVTALMLIVGGVLGDTDGRSRILRAATGALIVSGLSGVLFADGPLFLAGRLAGATAASIVVPFALAGVAVAYRGVPRATALGLAYAAYGGATAIAPVLLTAFGPTGPRWPAFAASTVAAVVATIAVGRDWTDLPTPSRRQRRRVIATAVWASGVIVTTMGVVGFGNGLVAPLRVAFLIGGLAIIGVAASMERGVSHDDGVHVERRPVGMALFVGFVIAFAQAAPLLQIPLFFELIAGYGAVTAVVATLPFVGALIVTGPIVGVLLGRVGPRPLITLGVAGIGMGNVLLAMALGPAAPYAWFVLPLALIGAGFVIATTVRTAIIFASVPRGLPATAAALNEASVALGTRVGLVVGTLVITRLTIDGYVATATATGQAQAAVATGLARLQELLAAIGSPTYGMLVSDIARPDRVEYGLAYIDAVRTMLILTGGAALVAAAVTWILVGRRDPLLTVWEHRDERTAPDADAPVEA